MTLVLCPECRGQISTRAAACPQCGYPLTGQALAPVVAPEAPLSKPPRPTSFITRRFALAWTATAAALGMFSLVGAMENEDGMVVFATLVLWGSSVPIWWKAYRSRKRGTVPGGGELERRVEARLQEAEERIHVQLAELDDHRRQVVELEERVDFAERLLTKHRDDQLGGS